MAAPDGSPMLRVVSGSPTPEELAVVVAVLAAAAQSGADDAPPGGLSRWAARESLVRRPMPTGPGAWRASALPR